jgi:hypothetical protein
MLKLQAGGDEDDEFFTNSFLRVAGHVRALLPHRDDYTEEFGRYQPRLRSDFIQMLYRCVGGWTCLVTPDTARDEEVVNFLEDCYSRTDPLFLRAARDEPIADLFSELTLGIRWLYLVGLTEKQIYAIFLSEDPAVVTDFEAHARGYANEYRIQERW